jgi:hypothetical protein
MLEKPLAMAPTDTGLPSIRSTRNHPQKAGSELRTTFGARQRSFGYSKLEERLRRERDKKEDSLKILERGTKVVQRARRSFLE